MFKKKDTETVSFFVTIMCFCIFNQSIEITYKNY
jgi:hypothetical protein